MEVEQITNLSSVTIGRLAGARAVVFNNVPAYKLPADFITALPFFVTEQGGGLAMIGGRYSFAAGGYFGSPLEPLLPVSMELKQEHRKLAVALAIVMDRSGSMSATVAGGRQKMDLANEGAGRAVELLGESDMISVFAVDSSAHRVVPLTPVGPNRASITHVVRRIQSTGGGIYVYEGLSAAWKELQLAHVGQRHLILFSDAADSEEPGDYEKLVDDMVKNKTSVSVIGMGTESDSDANLLKAIAARGKGRIFFNQDATSLPAIFAQETVAVARSAFVDEAVAVKPTAGWLELAGTSMEWLPKVDGYNLTYLRPGATQALVGTDEYAAPMLAFWQRGAGRVATVAFPLGGDFSAAARAWTGYGDLCQSLARWLAGEPMPEGLGLRATVDGTELRADLYYTPEWQQRLVDSPPRLILAAAEGTQAQEVPWERLAPNELRARLDLEGRPWVRGALRVGNTAIPFGPISAAMNPEWTFSKDRLTELRALVSASGGKERVDLSDVWRAPRSPAWQDLQRWLCAAMLVGILAEAWRTRAQG
jgi:uncharacterized membrane protein